MLFLNLKMEFHFTKMLLNSFPTFPYTATSWGNNSDILNKL